MTYASNFAFSRLHTEWLQSHTGDYIPLSQRLSPIIPVRSRQAQGYSFNRGDELRIETTRRLPGSVFHEKEVGATNFPVTLDQYGLQMAIADEDAADTNSPWANETKTVQQLWFDVMRHRDVTLLDTLTGSSWTQSSLVGSTHFTQWNSAGATIVRNLRTWDRAFATACGKQPNTYVISGDVWDTMIDSDELKAYVQNRGVKGDTVTTDYFAGIMRPNNSSEVVGMNNTLQIIVPTLLTNTANQGATASISEYFSDRIWIGYIDRIGTVRNNGIHNISATATLSWTEFDPGAQQGTPAIKVKYDDDRNRTVFRTEAFFKHFTPDLACGRNITDVLTP